LYFQYILDTTINQLYNEMEIEAAADDHVWYEPPSSKRLKFYHLPVTHY